MVGSCTSQERWLVDERLKWSGEMISSIKDLNASRMIMLGMDGPNVNWCVFDKINVEKNIVLHFSMLAAINDPWCLWDRMTSNQWEIGKIMKSMFKLFSKSPARRDLYIMISNSNVFPKRLVLLNFLKNLISNYLYFYGRWISLSFNS